MLSSTCPVPSTDAESPGDRQLALAHAVDALPTPPAGERAMPELKTRLHWLMGLRVVLVTLMLGLSLAFQSTRGESAPTFTALIVVTYTITILYALVLRRLRPPLRIRHLSGCRSESMCSSKPC